MKKNNKTIRVKITKDFASGLPGQMITGMEVTVPESTALAWINAKRAVRADSTDDQSFARRFAIRPLTRPDAETR